MNRQRQLALLLLTLLGLVLMLALPRSQAAGPPVTDPQQEPPKGPPGLEWALLELIRKEAGLEAAPPQRGLAMAPEPVKVVVEVAPGQVGVVAQSIGFAGGTVESTYNDLVQAQVPVSSLEGLAAAPSVRFIRRPFQPRPVVTSQGVSLVGADVWQQSGLTGRGVKIAVVDVGFQGYASLLGTELPAIPVVMSFTGDIQAGEPHGTAVAEIVYDIAPEAQLYLVNADTEVQLGNAVDWLIDQGVNVISHSVVWPGAGGGMGTGPLNDIVARARNSGILWVNAAGNEAQNHWGGTWRDDDGNGQLDFTRPDGSTDETNTIYASANSKIDILLTWDDPWGASANDYDLYLLDSNLNEVKRSLGTQSGFQDPVESIYYTVPSSGYYHVRIKRYSGQSARLSLFVYPQTPEYVEPAGSLLPPADSASALAVGAVPWSRPWDLESFSSQGPTLDGRTKPDLVGPDGVSTATPGYSSFYGTSAATPHVAGAAALARQLYSGMTPDQLRDFLRGRAIDLDVTGPDNLYGWGRLNLGAVVPASIRVTPAAATANAKSTQQFSASGLAADGTTPVTNLSFAWSVLDSDAGSITTSGLFTAGTRAGTYSNAIKASAQGVDGFASVTVTPASVSVTPATATVNGGASQQFAATGLAADGVTPVTNLTFAWSVLDPDAGSIDSTGLFTAGTRAGTYSNAIKASAQGVDGFASVIIPRIDLWLAPASLDMLLYDTFQLTVEVNATQTPVQEIGVFIDFDPARLEVLQVQPGSGLDNVETSRFDNSRGTIDYIATGTSQSGRFTLATITLKSRETTGSSALGFSSQQPRQTYARSAGEAVLYSASGSQVAVWDLPVADFEASNNQGPAPLTVQFSDRSQGAVTAWAWDFGDGATSIQRDPAHTYTAAGNYTVSLVVSNPAVSDSRSREALVNVYEPPAASFSAQPTSGNAPVLVQFSDLSTGNIGSWLWSFGDGTASDQQDPVHTYTSGGSYTVSLTVSGPAGSSTMERAGYISVTATGDLEGQVLLQGRSQSSTATVRLGETAVAAPADGRFRFSALAAGYHSLTLSAPGYLARSQQVEVVSGQAVSLPPLHLAAGDVDGDGSIDIIDLVAVAAQFNSAAEAGYADLNGDGWVDILDLTLVALNMGLST